MVAFIDVNVVTLLVVALIQADGAAAAAHLPAVATADHVALHGTSGIRGVLEVLIIVDKISSLGRRNWLIGLLYPDNKGISSREIVRSGPETN